MLIQLLNVQTKKYFSKQDISTLLMLPSGFLSQYSNVAIHQYPFICGGCWEKGEELQLVSALP